MANPTTNFGWVMPASTSLVTNLPADFNTFGQAVDTSMAELKGGTTGQVLSKTSNTDMDFTWIANDVGDITGVTAGTGISGGGTSGTVTITNSMATEITAKGDIIGGTGSATFDNLAVGSNGQVLTADSTATTGLKWASAATSGMTLIKRASFSAVSTTTTTFDSQCTTAYKSYVMVIETMSSSASNANIYLQFRKAAVTHATSYYAVSAGLNTAGTGFSYLSAAATQATLFQTSASACDGSAFLTFNNMGSGGAQIPQGHGTFYEQNSSRNGYLGLSTANSILADGWIFSASSGTITGTVSIYGLAI